MWICETCGRVLLLLCLRIRQTNVTQPQRLIEGYIPSFPLLVHMKALMDLLTVEFHYVYQ